MSTITQNGPLATELVYSCTRGDKWDGPTITISSATVDCTSAVIDAKLIDDIAQPVRYDFAPAVTAEETNCWFVITLPAAVCATLMPGTFSIPVRFQTDTFGPLTVAIIRLNVKPIAL